MLLHTITCPHCDGTFKSQAGIATGKTVACPKCRERFVVAAPAVTAPADDDVMDDDEAPRPAKRRKKAKSQSSAFVPLLVVGGFVVVIAVVGVGAYFAWRSGVTGPPVQQAAPGQPGQPQAAAPVIATMDPATFPELGPSWVLEPGIRFQEATLKRGPVPMRVWFYQPEKAAGKLPLVVVPPAGSTLFTGMDLGDGDRPEHLPYVRAGFAVMSFEIDGNVPNLQQAPDAVLFKAAKQFRDAQAGLANAKAALDFTLAKAPNVDPERITIAGHSSAGTLALLVAEHEPRIKACAAYCAVPDVMSRLAQAIPQLDRAMPGYRDFLVFSSPKTHADKLKCPVLLFHALDDNNVPAQQSTDFAEQLKSTNPQVTLITTPRGGHHDSMIREGIPKGIEWFRSLK
jgi:dienelactone hydrolase